MIRFLSKIIGGICILLTLTGVYLATFGTSDLRTETAKNSSNEEHAKALLQEMANAHGIEHWKNILTYEVEFEDAFFGPIGQMSHPFSEDTVQFSLTYIPNTYDGRLEFLSGLREGTRWGIQSWKTYIDSQKKGFRFKKSNDITFWLPTYQYFIEFPMRIQNANAFNYAGEKEINGKICEGILASWNTTEPQNDIDQYLIWLDKETKRIVKLEYTIREITNFIRGAAYFNDYKNYDGIFLPASLPVESNLAGEDFLHEMKILNFYKNPVNQKELRPNNALKVMGDEKQ